MGGEKSGEKGMERMGREGIFYLFLSKFANAYTFICVNKS